MVMATRFLPHYLVSRQSRQITVFTSNLGALLAVNQSGQASIKEKFSTARALRKRGNSISLVYGSCRKGISIYKVTWHVWKRY
jgi:hypothetical protein